MKTPWRGRGRRRLASLLVTAMVAPLLAYYSPPAQAQIQTPAVPPAGGTTERPTAVAVMAFDNITQRGGALLGRSAAAAVSQAMEDSGPWDPIRATLINRRIEELGLTPPLDLTALLQLGRALDADAIATGTVWLARVSNNQADVGIRVEIRSVASGELINGALTREQSGVRPNFTGDSQLLIDEALRKAAFSAVSILDQQRLPRGTVLTTQVTGDSQEVLLNVGAAAGVKEGMEFIVLRGTDRVGRLRVTRLEPDQSTAVVTESTRGVQPEDKVQALFQLPPIPTVREDDRGGVSVTEGPQPRARSKERRSSAIRNVLLALGGVLILALAFRGGSSSRTAVSNFAAQAISTFAGAPGAGEVLPNEAGIRVSWELPNIARQADVLGFEILRSDEPLGLPVWIADPGARYWVDTEREHDTVAPQGGGTGTGGGTGGTGANFQPRTGVTGVIPGRTVTYQVRMVHQRIIPGSGGGGTGDGTGGGTTQTQVLRTVLNTSGPATPYRPPTPAAPTADGLIGDLSRVTFQFNLDQGGNAAAVGPDQFVVQISTDPFFQQGVRTLGPNFLSPGNRTGAVSLENQNLTGLAAGRYFWRAGIRNSLDRPGPVGGFVFGPADSFTVQ